MGAGGEELEVVVGVFGKGFDSFDTTDLEEPLKVEAVGESDAEVTVIQAFEVPDDVAAKGENAVATEGFDTRCGGCFKIKFLVFDTKGDEVIFESGGGQDFIDANEALTLFAVFFESAKL